MLKLNDPFEMSDLFVGVFYNAEAEVMANEGKGSQKSNQRLKRLYRRLRVVWRKLLRAFEDKREAISPIGRAKASTPESRHLDGAPNESAASEFRPLTVEEKRQFLNSLNDDGRRILAELAGKSVASNQVSIAPDIGTSTKGMVHNAVQPMT